MDSLATAARLASQTLAPFAKALAGSDGLLLEYFRKLGWALPAVPPSLANLRTASGDWVASFGKLEAVLRQQVGGDISEDAVLEAAAKFVADLAKLALALRALPAGLRSELPQAFIDGSHLAEEFVERLFNDAIYRRIESHGRASLEALRLLGLAESTAMPADSATFQPAYEKKTIRWDRMVDLVSDPAAVMGELYGWGTPSIHASKLFLALRDLSFAIQCPVYFDYAPRPLMNAVVAGLADNVPRQPGVVVPLLADSPQEFVLGCYAMPTRNAAEVQGLMFTLASQSQLGLAFELSPALTLKIDGQIDLNAGVALALLPGQAPRLIGNTSGPLPVAIAGASATIALQYTPPDKQKLSLLNFDGLMLDAKGISLEAGFGAGADQATDFHVQATLPGLHLQLGGLAQDSFLSALLPKDASVEMDLAFGWSHLRGLYWASGAGPKITIPVSLTLGPAKIKALEIGFTSSGDTFTLNVGVSASATLGPVVVVVDGVGVGISVNTKGGNLGPVDVGFDFVPPHGVGLSIDAHGVVTGGGFIDHDPALGQYAGSLELTVHERLSLKAFGLVATRLPDGSRGYSMIVFITAEGFQPVQLGMGFALLGIGGMVAINRTFDEDVLRAGLKNDTLGQLLFPRNPVANAPAIIAALAAAFPARPGSYLLGLLVRIGWFTPALVTLDLALIFEFGKRHRLLILGRIAALLPSPDNDLVRLILDAMGVIDFDEGTASIDATLVDSRLAHKFPLTGDMAMRARWTKGPGRGFVLAVGGLNPHFAQPEAFPALKRVAIALASGDNPRLMCDAYIAITDNTVQFGAHASLHAAAYGFSIDGDVGFDVLIQLWPLHFIADFHASVQLKRGSTNLFMVTVQGELEGPRPLRVSGKATFSIFWCDFTVRLDKTLVDGELPPLPNPINLLEQLVTTLSNPSSWRALPANGRTQGVALRQLESSTRLVLEPLGQLQVRQQLVPLSTVREIDTFGGAPLSGARRFVLKALLDGVEQPDNPLTDGFAPAQFFAMSDDEKLGAPALEDMGSGLAFGEAAAQFAAAECVAAPLAYEQIVVDDLAAPPPPPRDRPRVHLAVERLQAWSATGAVARAAVHNTGRARFRVEGEAPAVVLATPIWRIVPLADVGEAPPPVVTGTTQTYSENLAVLAQLNRAAPRWQIVPAHELMS